MDESLKQGDGGWAVCATSPEPRTPNREPHNRPNSIQYDAAPVHIFFQELM